MSQSRLSKLGCLYLCITYLEEIILLVSKIDNKSDKWLLSVIVFCHCQAPMRLAGWNLEGREWAVTARIALQPAGPRPDHESCW